MEKRQRAGGKKGAKKADGLQACLDAIEKTAPEDRAVAERVHQDAAHLDDGEIWAVSFALPGWSPAVEQKVTELMKAAVS